MLNDYLKMGKLRRIVNALNRGNFSTIRNILSEPSPNMRNQRFETRDTPTNAESIMFDLINDRGEGRITKGLRSLELTSLTFTGRDVNSTLRFGTQEIYVNRREFKSNNNPIRKIELISAALGFGQNNVIRILPAINSDLYGAIFVVFTQMHDDVLRGKFFLSNYENLLPTFRRVANIIKQQLEDRS